jgi:dolichyl-phosphate-mannose--protein O-mannosyl transferase
MMKDKIWYYVSLTPLVYAIIGFGLAYTSLLNQWGGDAKIATVISVFFCETVMVISVFGALSYMKQPDKTPAVKNIFRLNLLLALTGLLFGLYLFMTGTI